MKAQGKKNLPQFNRVTRQCPCSICGRWAKDLNQETAQVILDHATRVNASSIVVCGNLGFCSGGGKENPRAKSYGSDGCDSFDDLVGVVNK